MRFTLRIWMALALAAMACSGNSASVVNLKVFGDDVFLNVSLEVEADISFTKSFPLVSFDQHTPFSFKLTGFSGVVTVSAVALSSGCVTGRGQLTINDAGAGGTFELVVKHLDGCQGGPDGGAGGESGAAGGRGGGQGGMSGSGGEAGAGGGAGGGGTAGVAGAGGATGGAGGPETGGAGGVGGDAGGSAGSGGVSAGAGGSAGADGLGVGGS
jgi:hypothetical protein